MQYCALEPREGKVRIAGRKSLSLVGYDWEDGCGVPEWCPAIVGPRATFESHTTDSEFIDQCRQECLESQDYVI
jgi:hypothetical protein